jgi:alginate biosynthesis protein AlgX
MLTVAQSLPAGESYFFKRDHHWTPAGARAAARALADLIKAQTAYAELEKMEFITSVVGEAAYTGGWGAEVEAHCSTELPSEKMIVYETEATTQIGLFDELPPAEVVLVGTSFSQPAREPGFNFEGFLKEHLSLDVLNMAVPGGGMFASIYSYFPSHEFQEHKPRFLIWELSVQSSKVFFDEGVYRQIIASLYGSCQGLLEESAELQPRLELLANDDNLNIQGDDYYILLEFSDITLVNFEVTLLAHNGKSESLMIERSTRVINNGRFALELSNKGQYKQTILSLPENAQGIVHARLCRSG